MEPSPNNHQVLWRSTNVPNQDVTLRESRDPIIRAAVPTVATGRKWNAATEVEEAMAVLRH